MEGNRFHDPGTPPPLHLDQPLRLPFETNTRETSSSPTDTTLASSDTPDNDEKSIAETTLSSGDANHTDRALELVETITRDDLRRKPSKAGVLSNLLKLDLFDHRARHGRHHQQRPQPIARPIHQLRSIASSRAMLQTLGQSTQSARSSLYFDELYKAEMGMMDEATQVAQRMQITAEIADILERQDFIVKLGKSLVRTGAPSHRIEAAMEKVSKRLEIDGSYVVLPGLIMVTFGDVETHTSETHLIKCSRALDIGKLERVNVIAHRIGKGQIELSEASALLDDIKNEPPTWNFWWTLLGYIFSSAFVAPLFFNGSWTDMWVSAIFGLAVGLLTFLSEKVPMFGNVFEIVVSILVSVVTIALHPHVCFTAVSLSAIVIALPGYAVTSAVMELSAKNIGSGAIHLVHAIMYVLFLGFGLGYGTSVWHLSHPGQDIEVMAVCQNPVSPWWFFLLLPLTGIGISIVFGAAVNQFIPLVGNTAVGFAVYYFLSLAIGSQSVIVPSVGAFALGLTGNLYGRLTKRLAFVPLIGGIIILVPGSIGVKGALQLFDDSDNANGGTFAVQIIGIALSITLGLFLSNLCVYPRGRKRSVFLGF